MHTTRRALTKVPSRITLDDQRRNPVARTTFTPTSPGRAIVKPGHVQADPIRAQDLALRHRIGSCGAGDLEHRDAPCPRRRRASPASRTTAKSRTSAPPAAPA